MTTARTFPLGATVLPGGVDFGVFSGNPIGLGVVFFDRDDDAQPIAL
jgi:hypothetical protein